MKSILLSVAACAGLAGCVGYVDPHGGYAGPGVYSEPAYIYGGPTVQIQSYPAPGYPHRPARDRTYRDRDRDGVPNRYDRDRDGDGVPNRLDPRPNNPRR